jgi:hypothetical protein
MFGVDLYQPFPILGPNQLSGIAIAKVALPADGAEKIRCTCRNFMQPFVITRKDAKQFTIPGNFNCPFLIQVKAAP